MEKEKISELNLGFQTAYIDGNIASSIDYRPSFISNDYSEGKKVISSIEEELLKCDSFKISVAFITKSGITPLLQTLKELEEKNIPGEILTTDYLAFSDPEALTKLHTLKNIKLKMYIVENSDDGFHTKGYIFKQNEIYHIIIGSSNITRDALTTNKEWNTKFISTENGEMGKQVLSEFETLWNSSNSKEYDDFIEEYKEKYSIVKTQREIAVKEEPMSLAKYKLTPNSMQTGFILNLKKIIDCGENHALLISATGTGKTYASAFAMRELGFRRVLFLVHRGQLAVQAKESYEKVFDNSFKMGLVGNGQNDVNADYIFATIQTVSRDDHIKDFEHDQFDCIIIDEAHHSSADSYQKIMNYFTPRLWLGMTATPDKNDKIGDNIYEIYDHQIAYEIRLQQAMEENMLCPFHYFGISDLSIIGDELHDGKTVSYEKFKFLVSDERIKHIIEKSNYYGFSGDRVKGLVFCSSIKESIELSNKFNELVNDNTGKKYRTIALNGDASEEKREEAFERLAMDEKDATAVKQPLDYIFSVDILNEGVDIVEVNQVIMLRPTQSPIIFIQQLGRGLRKAKNKEYLVVLDFIGNYDNNFMIPIALSGDRSYNKDNVRRYIMEGERIIPGASTIHFDSISRKKIFAAVDKANFSDVKLIKENYLNLKNKLGHIPALQDFDDYGEMDVLRIFDNNSLGSYYTFLKKYEKDYTVTLSKDEETYVDFISQKLAEGKRVQELKVLKKILSMSQGEKGKKIFASLKDDMRAYGKDVGLSQKQNIINILTNIFPVSANKKKYEKCVFIKRFDEDYVPTQSFLDLLKNPDFYHIVDELVKFGISRFERDYKNTYDNTDLVLYKKYTYEDVCRLLNWENNVVSLNIGGYKYDQKTKTYPVFINYDKSDDISATIKYEDHFLNNTSLIAISKSGRSKSSEDVQNFLYSKERGIQVELFVRKNKDDKISKEFYYLGHMTPTGKSEEFMMPDTEKSAVKIEWKLDVPVRDDIYEYIVNA